MDSSYKQHHLSSPCQPTNNETLRWYKESLENGKVSEDRFKSEAVAFFNLSSENTTKSKPMFKREILNFVTMHANMQKNLTRDFLRHQGGSGKHFEEPPNDFEAEIKDEKERKKMFSKFGREGMISSKSYNKWLGQDCNIFTDSMERSTERSVNEDEDIEDGLNEKIKLVRERSSGHNIFDAEKTVFTKCQDGTTKKSVIKETYAKLTIRKRHQGTLESTKEYEISGSGATKRAKAVDNILNHTSDHDKLAKSVMVAKIIDKEGSEFISFVSDNFYLYCPKIEGVSRIKS